jgi:hypothetical protein
MRLYVLIFIIISVALGYEWMILNESTTGTDLLSYFPSLKDYNRSTLPGRPLSLVLGYIGIGLMCVMNIYTIRKKASFMKVFGSKERFLDFHIFCGMTGTVFIIFHTNFVVGGLVAISFWSMIVSATSGIIGKFFYSQILLKRSSLMKRSVSIEAKLVKFYEKINNKNKAKGRELIEHGDLKYKFMDALGVKYEEYANHEANVIAAIINTFTVPMKYTLQKKSLRSQTCHKVEFFLLQSLAQNQRKIYLLNANKKIMGHWSTFHKPFAVFMYLIAIIHIASALFFQVKH